MRCDESTRAAASPNDATESRVRCSGSVVELKPPYSPGSYSARHVAVDLFSAA
jgi:hypothetical protein